MKPARAVWHLRSSVLAKVLAALVVVLVVSTVVTGLVDARLTRAAVARQTDEVSSSHLRVLQEAFTQRQRMLVQTLQAIADDLVSGGLTGAAQHAALVQRLSQAANTYQLDQLDVLDEGGAALAPAVSVGRLSPQLPIAGLGAGPTSRLVRTAQGRYVQAAPVPVGTGTRPLVLLGGREFGDGLAYDLRRAIGGLANVILVAGPQVAGSTLPTPALAPPAYAAGSAVPPEGRREVRLGGRPSVVAYVPVGRSARDPAGGALGVALADPAASLGRDLAARRLATAALLGALAVLLGWLLFRALTQPLVRLAGTARRIAAGRLDEPFETRGGDEIGQLAASLEHMRRELQGKLEVVERQAAELQQSSQRVVAAQDEERRRLARDLHDGVQQQLVVLRMRLGATHAVPEGLLGELGDELDRAIEQLREVSHDLYPAILRDRGLAAAVRSYAGRLPVPTTLSVDPDPLPRMADDVESAAYFLVCEAVTNALKHAGAADLSLSLAAGAGRLRVTVRDDGRGFDPASTGHRSGLRHMDDRVRAFGGDLRITTAPGEGTTVSALFPAPAADGAPGAVLEPAAP